MDVGVLGPVEVRASGRTIAVGGSRQRALLAALVAHRGRTVARELLVDTLWPDDPPPSAIHTLHTHVSRLRRTLDLPIRGSDGGYYVDLAESSLDSALFDAWLTQAGRAEALAAVELTERALELWRGPAFGGAADLPAVRGEARRLEERRLGAREILVTRLVGIGRSTDAVILAEALVADEPVRESAWTALVRALVAAGRPADAAAAFHRAADALDELGLVPADGLRAAHAEALGSPRDGPPTRRAPGARPSAPTGPARTQVPVLPTRFVGRRAEVETVQHLLECARLVTLVGPGGVGKTRLALEVTRRAAPAHTSGVRILELSTLTDAATLPAATLAALGLGADAGTAEQSFRRAGDLDVLVLVDNCEHLLDGVAHLVEHLLAGSRARVIATSRERLQVPGEHVHVVAPLATSPDDPAARELFVDRAVAAGSVRSGLDDDLVDRVVRGLDGLPLAIEMAAARTATVGLAELAATLGIPSDPEGHEPASPGVPPDADSSIARLTHPYRHSEARHRSLPAVIAWSQALLAAPEREAMVRWPVFVGPVEASDAAAVLDADQESVVGLAARSLLLPLEDASSGRTRYRMLHTVRAAVLARSGHQALPRERHAAHFARVAARADADLRAPSEGAAVARLASVVAELRSAHAWARGHDLDLAADLSASLHVFAVGALDDDILGWASRLVPLVPEGDPRTAPAHASGAARLAQSGELRAAAARAQLALALSATTAGQLPALEVLADAALYDGRLDECRVHATRLAELAIETGDPHYLAMAAGSLSLAHAYAGDRAAALVELGRLRGVLTARFDALSPTIHGWLAYVEGEIDLDVDPARATVLLRRAVMLADSVGNRYLGGVARVSATSVDARHGDPVVALGAFDEVLRWWLERGDRTHLLTTLRAMVDLFLRLDAPRAAAELWACVGRDELSQTYGVERARLDRARDRLSGMLDADRLTEHVDAGARRDVESAARAALDAARVLRSG